MSKEATIAILLVLLSIGNVMQNIVIHNMRKTIAKQIEISEKQAELSQMMIDSMASMAKLKGVQP